MDRASLVAVRDPYGFRPLCLGTLRSGWVIASETAALDIIGAEFVRQIEPGEVLVIDGDGPGSRWPFARTESRLCLFEFVYFARPDSYLQGRNVHAARWQMGYRLAEQAPVQGDIVVPVPESGIPAAQGFAACSRIPYADGLVKNRYVGRTFIEPAQSMRDQGIRMKLNPIGEVLDGQRVVLVDDSIVRGSTTRQLVGWCGTPVPPRSTSAFRRRPTSGRASTGWTPATATPCSPPTACRGESRSSSRSTASPTYPGVGDRSHRLGGSFCTACLVGDYPTAVPRRGQVRPRAGPA